MDKALAFIFVSIVAVIGIYGCLSMVSISRSFDEQNKILKELVIAVQNQANAIQEQNKILNYNPMEENK